MERDENMNKRIETMYSLCRENSIIENGKVVIAEFEDGTTKEYYPPHTMKLKGTELAEYTEYYNKIISK